MRLVLFDCDGTLVDSANFIHDCMVRTIDDFGYPVPDVAETKAIIGLTLDVAIAELLQRPVDAEVTAMTAHYQKTFRAIRERGNFHEPMFDGMAEVLAGLAAEEETVLGVVTGKSRRGLASVLATHGLERTFITMRTADDCPSKPHPAMVLECCRETGFEPHRTVVVGDAIHDMAMAKAAGARALGVAWGYAEPNALAAAGADAIAPAVADLRALIDEAVPMGADHA
ncbi:HAD-IA family hydrolase [Pararhizobium mangrovi]|uniref:HAD-IA family hydrolase n=1 Tax=Pararhizobium mangrovi TaxID=2590452 RepID=A0A506U4P2_9HYPH|nr:HAD-IA family hydrolase [Pararhizobium mangrovi]TPW29332.1 HAD-IA family hydrolase [Pararhizobium mangrovi]